MNLGVFLSYSRLYFLIYCWSCLICNGFFQNHGIRLSFPSFQAERREESIYQTSWMKYLQNGAILVIDGDNVRGKTGFQLTKDDLCEDLTSFLHENHLNDQVIVAFDHGFEEEGIYLEHHSMAIVFSGPSQKADDVIARDILWLQKTFHLPILLVTDDFLLGKRTQSMNQRFNLFSKYLGKQPKSMLPEDKFAQQAKKSRPHELRILSSKQFIEAVYGGCVKEFGEIECNKEEDNNLPLIQIQFAESSNISVEMSGRNPIIQIEINTLKKEYISLSKLQLYLNEVSNPITFEEQKEIEDTATASFIPDSKGNHKLHAVIEDLKDIYSQYYPYQEYNQDYHLHDQQQLQRIPPYCYNIYSTNRLNEKEISFRKCLILQRLAYYRTFFAGDYFASLQNKDNPDRAYNESNKTNTIEDSESHGREDLWDRILDAETFRLALKKEIQERKEESSFHNKEDEDLSFATKLSIYINYFNRIRPTL